MGIIWQVTGATYITGLLVLLTVWRAFSANISHDNRSKVTNSSRISTLEMEICGICTYTGMGIMEYSKGQNKMNTVCWTWFFNPQHAWDDNNDPDIINLLLCQCINAAERFISPRQSMILFSLAVEISTLVCTCCCICFKICPISMQLIILISKYLSFKAWQFILYTSSIRWVSVDKSQKMEDAFI